MKYLYLLPIVFMFACSTEPSQGQWEGEWKALWQTDPSGYPEIADKMDFTMKGKFTFKGDSITIVGYGYEGCIFTEDTIRHTLLWKLRNDSLLLFNEVDNPGLTYKISETGNGTMKLQLEDIFVSLNK